jgi:hypothetical protein
MHSTCHFFLKIRTFGQGKLFFNNKQQRIIIFDNYILFNNQNIHVFICTLLAVTLSGHCFLPLPSSSFPHKLDAHNQGQLITRLMKWPKETLRNLVSTDNSTSRLCHNTIIRKYERKCCVCVFDVAVSLTTLPFSRLKGGFRMKTEEMTTKDA